MIPGEDEALVSEAHRIIKESQALSPEDPECIRDRLRRRIEELLALEIDGVELEAGADPKTRELIRKIVREIMESEEDGGSPEEDG